MKFFGLKDALRVMLLASSLFLIASVLYSVFLHAQLSGQINTVRTDLIAIKDWFDDKADAAKQPELARQYRDISATAENLANNISGPRLNPYAYTYLNYWITSAGFIKIYLTWEELGLEPGTISALRYLEEKNWFGNETFKTFDISTGQFVQRLEKRPELPTYFWTFYLFVLVIVAVSVWIGVKEEYEIQAIPYILYGGLSLIPFWVIYLTTSLISIIGLFQFLRPEQISLGAYLTDFIITLIISGFAGAIVSFLQKGKKEEV